MEENIVGEIRDELEREFRAGPEIGREEDPGDLLIQVPVGPDPLVGLFPCVTVKESGMKEGRGDLSNASAHRHARRVPIQLLREVGPGSTQKLHECGSRLRRRRGGRGGGGRCGRALLQRLLKVLPRHAGQRGNEPVELQAVGSGARLRVRAGRLGLKQADRVVHRQHGHLVPRRVKHRRRLVPDPAGQVVSPASAVLMRPDAAVLPQPRSALRRVLRLPFRDLEETCTPGAFRRDHRPAVGAADRARQDRNEEKTDRNTVAMHDALPP